MGSLRDIIFSELDATKDQIKERICGTKTILLRPLPLTKKMPEIALIGYQEESTDKILLLETVRVFQNKQLFNEMAELSGYMPLVVFPWQGEGDDLKPSEPAPNYRAYENFVFPMEMKQKEPEHEFIVEDGRLIKFEAEDYVEEVYVPNTVKCVGEQSFYEARVGKVILPDSVTVIEEDAFLDCTLKEIVIPNSVTTIEAWAFTGCECLTSITIPESVTSIGPWAIGYRRDLFQPWLDAIPFYENPVTIYGKKGSEAERYAKDNEYNQCEHVTIFKEITE